MAIVRNFCFLGLCLALGVGMAKGYLWWAHGLQGKNGFEHHDEVKLVTGIGDAPGNRGFAVGENELQRLPELAKQWSAMFATTVGIEYSESMSQGILAEAVKAAHRMGMSVVILPPRGKGGTVDDAGLRNPYSRELAEVAANAQAAGADFMCISWLKGEPDEVYWRQQIAKVRSAYHGKVILGGTAQALPEVGFWDAVDVMGLMGPLPFARRLPNAPDDVTAHDVRIAWECALTEIESLAKSQSKKLALLHANVPLEVSFKLPPVGMAGIKPPKNSEAQRMLYEGLLLETKGRAETTQMLVFDWEGDGPRDVSELAEKITGAWDPKKPKVVEATPLEEGDSSGGG